ncbi:hypothetical protein BUE93_21240 [Chromobacterium amazonense]|uniref:Uncharacterized protein n=1 Tax=Chromobacterium amazonense TaxID=1382803 RepID=A0A2S9WYU5_9NEIS|nr:hypothetical protein BUE93_21240 [Chromobacterium amazonense]
MVSGYLAMRVNRYAHTTLQCTTKQLTQSHGLILCICERVQGVGFMLAIRTIQYIIRKAQLLHQHGIGFWLIVFRRGGIPRELQYQMLWLEQFIGVEWLALIILQCHFSQMLLQRLYFASIQWQPIFQICPYSIQRRWWILFGLIHELVKRHTDSTENLGLMNGLQLMAGNR